MREHQHARQQCQVVNELPIHVSGSFIDDACLCRDSLIPWVALAAHHLSHRLIVRVPVLSLIVVHLCKTELASEEFCCLRPGTAGGAGPGSPGPRVRRGALPSKAFPRLFVPAPRVKSLISSLIG